MAGRHASLSPRFHIRFVKLCRSDVEVSLSKEFKYDEVKNQNQSGRRFALVLDVIKVHRTNQIEFILD